VKIKYNDEITVEITENPNGARVFLGDKESDHVTAINLNHSASRLESGFFSELTITFGIDREEVLDDK